MSCRNENLHIVAERLNIYINKVQADREKQMYEHS